MMHIVVLIMSSLQLQQIMIRKLTISILQLLKLSFAMFLRLILQLL
ncbi:Uncharacterised protein [Klebsiella variicola]|nr:Uncharacterised protein [Klebsiella variicola]